MTKQQIQKMEDLAEAYTSTSYFSLEYSINGKTAHECQDAYKAGYQAAMSEVQVLVEALEHCRDFDKSAKFGYDYGQEVRGHKPKSGQRFKTPKEISHEALKTWRDKHE